MAAQSASPSGSIQIQSRSRQQRERGNGFYKSAFQNFGHTVRVSKMDYALTCYRNALSCSNNEEEEVSALKNVGIASWKLAAMHVENGNPAGTELIKRYFKDSVKHFGMAYSKRFCKDLSWGYKLEESFEKCLKESTDWLATMDMEVRIAGFSEMLEHSPECRLKAVGYVQYATLLFHEGLTSWQKGAYKECFRYMSECHFPIHEVERLCEGDPYMTTEVRVLREDVYLHTCVAESSMARATGDGLLKDLLHNEDSLNIEMVWTVIDLYKEAAMMCRDKDLEQEAIAFSRLGRVFGKVLKMSSRGKDYYKRVIQLALTMSPRSFHGVDWYMEATEFVENFQKQLNKEEVEDEDKEEALKEMAEDVEKLKKMDDECEAFLEELYKAWPPKVSGAKFVKTLSKKKALIKAISHYHLDKVDKEVQGKNWFYFSQEITKILNKRYTTQKFPEDYR